MGYNNPILDAALMVYEENIEKAFEKIDLAISTNILTLMFLSENKEEEEIYTEKSKEILKKKVNEFLKNES